MTELWIKADGPDSRDDRRKLVISALEAGIGTAIVRPEDSGFSKFGKIRLIFSRDGKLSDDTVMMSVGTPAEQKAAMSMAGKDVTIIADTPDWTVIPLENIVASFRNTPTRIMVHASDVNEAKLLSGILEKGVDGIVVNVSEPGRIAGIVKALNEKRRTELSVLTVTEVRTIEMGDRVCVDTVSMMHPGEGMLVGSQSECLFLVQSESEDNGYVAARPFRVNAGAVHAYILGPDGKTRYLSELRSGDPIALVGRDGATRTSSVGRCKIERRPLLMVAAAIDGKEYTTILQNAETVKLVTPDGSVSVSELKPGDRVLARIDAGGRHFGMKVDETVREI